MKTFLRTLPALVLFMHAAAYAIGGAPTPDQAIGKSRQNVNRQTFGPYVAARMSDAFDGKSATIYPCGDRPAYYCQGLMVTAFESTSTYWMDPNTPKLSFTYFRKDIATALYGTAGLVLWPQAYVDHDFPKSGPAQQPFTPVYRCAFPLDGNTNERTDTGCGAELLTNTFVNGNPGTRPCQSIGIMTAQEWLNKYQNAGMMFCGFGLNLADGSDKQGMEAMIQVAATLQKNGTFYLFPWNEVVSKSWPVYDPGRIPLMAFFLITGQNGKAAVSQAPDSHTPKANRHESLSPAQVQQHLPGTTQTPRKQYSMSDVQTQQKRYYDLTGIFVPIIEISQANEAAVFMYRDEDQAPGIPNIVTVYPK